MIRMSDVEEPTTSRIEKIKKPRAPMTDTQKAVLAKGRAKLAAQRQTVRDRILDIEADPLNAVDSLSKAAPKTKKKVQRVVVEDESDSEPDEIHVVRRRTSKKKPQKVVYDSESEGEADEEEDDVVVETRKPKARPPAHRTSRSATPRPPPEPAAEPFTMRFF